MTTEELDRSLRQLRLGGMADALSIRSQQARTESLGPLDFISLSGDNYPDRSATTILAASERVSV